MADDSTTNHPSLPSDYVSILDLRDRWLKKQQQKQPQHQEEEQVRIKTTIRDKGKEKVQEEVTTKHPSLPTNYVTIVDLQERWLKRQQQRKEENDRIETRKRDKGKEIVQEVTVDCQFDGISVKNNPTFRNPNPNLIPERGFYKNAKEKAQVTVDCQVDGNSDKNSPHFRNSNPNLIPERGFCRNTKEKAQVTVDSQVYGNADKNSVQLRNPNPNLIRERGFRRNPNWNNRRPIHRGFHGGEKISTQNQAVKASNSSLEASETSDGVEIEAEIVDDGGQLIDAPLMSRAEKRRIWLNKRRERRLIAKKEREDEEMRKLNVSKVGEIREQTRAIEAKMKEINVSKSRGIGEKTRETEAKMKEINVLKIGGIAEKTRETEAMIKDINVSKFERIAEKTRGSEAKMKEINVSKIKGIGERTREIEAKMKEMTVREECSPDKAKEVVLAEKSVLMRKNVGEVRCGDGRAKTGQNMEVYGKGRRVSNEPRWANTGEGNRGVKGGLMWVKKGEGADKVLNNGCDH